ncbi:MAG: hypothetical protein L0Y80_08090 [Ignavibacteriae bacterium]|nr:hypothetical protein [Ignavibacteriota bacterium]
MKTALLLAILGLLPVQIFAQHYNWTIISLDGSELEDVHPDTIRNDSVGFSNPEGAMYWRHLDSLLSFVYSYNPIFIPAVVMGGAIGALNEDNRIAGVVVGSVVGVGIGYVVGDLMGREEVLLAGLPYKEKVETIRRRVAHWTGKVTVLR